MTQSRSSRASRYGALIEQAMQDRYDLDGEQQHQAWKDAVGPSGNPWEIKGASISRTDDRRPKFRIFRDPHNRLARADGFYAFAAYRPRGRGIEIIQSKAVRARELRIDWRESDHHSPNRGAGEQKIPLQAVFD